MKWKTRGTRSIRRAVQTLICVMAAISIFSACATLKPLPVDPAEAQKTVFQAVTSNQMPQTIASYTILGSQAGFNGYVIAYWMCRPATLNNRATALSGYAIVRRYLGQNGIQNMTQGGGGLPKVDSLVEFTAVAQDNSDGKVSIIFGRILSPQVRAVEVEYADQQKLSWPAGSNGFLLFRNEPIDWVRLNVIGENDQILKTYELARDSTTISEREENQFSNCPGQK